MNITSKADKFSPAFELKDGGLVVKSGVRFDADPINPFVHLQEPLAAGVDYSIHPDDLGRLTASTARVPGEVGGFHVGLDGNIVEASIWDPFFRPAAPDPRGMVYVAPGYWVDIYLAGEDGTSRAGAKIARNITWWKAVELLAAQGKSLLSIAEFYLAVRGVTEGKACGARPELTGHAEGLRSDVGLEQATGCMWTWGNHCDPRTDTAVIMGGYWGADDSGPRRLSDGGADVSDDIVGARGRCGHLSPVS